MTQLQTIIAGSQFAGYALGALRVATERFDDCCLADIAQQMSNLHDKFLAIAVLRADAGQISVDAFLAGYRRGYVEFNREMTVRQAYDIYSTTANNLLDMLAA